MANQNGTGFFSSIPPVTKNLIIINVLMQIIGPQCENSHLHVKKSFRKRKNSNLHVKIGSENVESLIRS